MMAEQELEVATGLLGVMGLAETNSSDEEGTSAERGLSREERKKRDCWKSSKQGTLKLELVERDCEEVLGWSEGTADSFAGLHHVGGVDISFDKETPNHACAMLCVLSFPSLEVVHVSSALVEMTEPYIPGFLAFREVGFLLELLECVREKCPHLAPQVIMVDGNGVLHPRGFGLASHLGVLSGIPCIGVGKQLFHVDGLTKGAAHREKVAKELLEKGDHFKLKGDSGRVWGAALRTSDHAPNPVYVSVGHRISLETAVKLTIACSLKRVPEPIRQADIRSREQLRKTDYKKPHYPDR